eukprot:jgi/Mesvir1/11770/Mv00137-RA.1
MSTEAAAAPELDKRHRIQISNTKKPLFFYVNLAKRFMQQYEEVELSALGMAISTAVTVAEILKNNHFAVERNIRTTFVVMDDKEGGRPHQKAMIEILLGKSESFDQLMAEAEAAAAASTALVQEHHEGEHGEEEGTEVEE